jgi:hypothetical protein
MAPKKPLPQTPPGAALRALVGSAENLRDVAKLASATIGNARTDLDAVATAADLLAERLSQLATEAERAGSNGGAS